MNIVPNSKINTNNDFLINAEYFYDPIEKTITKYNNHPSIITIKKFILNSDSIFSFQHCSKGKITKMINMHCVKSVQIRSIFWSVFSGIWTEYGEIRSISLY